MRIARNKKPKGIQFMNDLARRTLDRRAKKIPQMLEHRKNGKTAFMIIPIMEDLLAKPMNKKMEITLALMPTVVKLNYLSLMFSLNSNQ